METSTPYLKIDAFDAASYGGEVVERRPDPRGEQVYKQVPDGVVRGSARYEGVWWIEESKQPTLATPPKAEWIDMGPRYFAIAMALILVLGALIALLIIGVTWR